MGKKIIRIVIPSVQLVSLWPDPYIVKHARVSGWAAQIEAEEYSLVIYSDVEPKSVREAQLMKSLAYTKFRLWQGCDKLD